jgi:hypothetical protein
MKGEISDSQAHRIQCRATLSGSRAIATRDKKRAEEWHVDLEECTKNARDIYFSARYFP